MNWSLGSMNSHFPSKLKSITKSYVITGWGLRSLATCPSTFQVEIILGTFLFDFFGESVCFPHPETGSPFGAGLKDVVSLRQEAAGPLSDGYAKFVADGVATGGGACGEAVSQGLFLTFFCENSLLFGDLQRWKQTF